MKILLGYMLLAFLLLLINYKFFYITYLSKSFGIFLYTLSIYSVVFLFMTYLFSFNRVSNRIWLLFLWISSLFTVYFINTMGLEINKQIIKNVMATNPKEARELLSIQFLFYSSIALVLLFYMHKLLVVPLKRVDIKQYFLVIIVLVGMFFMLTKIDEPSYKTMIKRETSKIVPLSLFPAFANYIRTKSREEKIIKKNISIAFSYEQSKKPLVSVLVIGESARSDRFSINGYEKNTTPHLENIHNLISFTDALSCDTSTLSSVPCMVLRVGQDMFSFPVKENSFVSVFKDNGFDTHWLSLQDEAKTIHTFCEEAKECISSMPLKYDMDIMVHMNKILSTITKDTLIVIHANGSHMDYNKRVPEKHKIFQPLCLDAYETCSQERLNNSYDNTIYYTDIFLSKMIHSLKEKNAFLLYASDHGESLGERYLGIVRRFGHASPYDVAPKEQTHIPFIFWSSESFSIKHPSLEGINKNKHVSHDFIFHTMLGCAGFEGNYIKKELNLCEDNK